ncbi:MAG: DUF2721 domain-containing protein [Bacteroidales bacterium]
MEELTLTTPSLLFSAVSLIMLAYTNRFISYAQLVRNLTQDYEQNPTQDLVAQITNLRKRLYLIRLMQVLGIVSLFLCVVTMFLIYVGFQNIAVYIFGLGMFSLIGSLGVSIQEITISVKALEIHLSKIETKTEK